MSIDTNWTAIVAGLRAWHQDHNRPAGERALVAVEQWLRTRQAARLRRQASAEDIDALFQDVLTRLWTRDLLSDAESPAAFLSTVVRNLWLDRVRKRSRQDAKHKPLTAEMPEADPSPASPEHRIELERVTAVLQTLRIEDRVHIKICDLPHALSWEELTWMAQRCGEAATAVRDAVLAADADAFSVSFLVDPGPAPTTKKERRDRLERFRRRRSRARTQLRAALEAS